MEYNLNDYVVMKKAHACGENNWQITRIGVDIKIKCLKCNREVMFERIKFDKKIKKIKGENNA